MKHRFLFLLILLTTFILSGCTKPSDSQPITHSGKIEKHEIQKVLEKKQKIQKVLEKKQKSIVKQMELLERKRITKQKTNKLIKKNFSYNSLKKAFNRYHQIKQGEFEKRSNFLSRLTKEKKKIPYDKFLVSEIKPSTLKYDPDDEEWKITLGTIESPSIVSDMTQAFFKFTYNKNSQHSNYIASNAMGAKIKVKSIKYEENGFSVLIGSNVLNSISLPMTNNKAKRLKNKIKVKLVYELDEKYEKKFKNDSYIEAKFDSPNEYYIFNEYIMIKPIGYIIYYKNTILKYVSNSDFKINKLKKRLEKIQKSIINIKESGIKSLSRETCWAVNGKVTWDLKQDIPICEIEGTKVDISK